MNILVLGDVVSDIGCRFLRKKLPAFKKLKNIDFCIANGENSAAGNGITPLSARELFSSGVDFITTGNHVYRRKEVYELLDESEFIIRPYNYPDSNPGRGAAVVDLGRYSVGVINLMGTMFSESLENPFRAADRALKEIEGKTKVILVDFHAEATSEKQALAHYLDGRITAFFGTHTHVATADECILPKGTAYITDVGMCGPDFSVLGIKPECIIEKMTTCLPVKFIPSTNKITAHGIIVDVDQKTKKATSIQRITF
jgi:metallophosphoesterase (TIGR00282 family)